MVTVFFLLNKLNSLRLVPRNRGRKPAYTVNVHNVHTFLPCLRLVPRNRGRKPVDEIDDT